MKKKLTLLIILTGLLGSAHAQELHTKWEELKASDWPRALHLVKTDQQTLKLQQEFFDRVKGQ